MIPVTRISGDSLLLNSDLIEHVEAAHDTIVTLTNGQRFVVRESPEELVERVIRFRRTIAGARWLDDSRWDRAGIGARFVGRRPAAGWHSEGRPEWAIREPRAGGGGTGQRRVAGMGKLNRPDLATIGGLIPALGGIIGGLILEGGSLKDIGQYTAALIVIGGTLGAVMVSTPLEVLLGAIGRVRRVFFEPRQDLKGMLDSILVYALKARKTGLVSLEKDADQMPDPFLRKALNLAVDGCDLQEIRKMMELEIDLAEERAEAEAKVFETAGGYAPTIGIIGAVLGLIQVMKKLADTEQVGHGIAVAFVATVYGVAFANIFFLPIAQKIRARARTERASKELMLEGVCGIVEGLNPKLIRSNLEAFLPVPPNSSRPAVTRGREAA